MRELVRLRMRPSRDGRSFSYFLDYIDPSGRRERKSLGHTDPRKAKAEQAQVEKQLRMGAVAPESMRLREFVVESLNKTGDQIRESTRQGYEATMKEFIAVIGDKDFQRVTLADGEFFRQHCLDGGGHQEAQRDQGPVPACRQAAAVGGQPAGLHRQAQVPHTGDPHLYR